MPIAENGSVRLHYEMSGSGSREVLAFSNSLGSSLQMWDKVMPRLDRRFRVLRYDTRGHGLSSVPPGPYTINRMGHDLLFLLDHLGIERVNLCGLSLGGMVAMWTGIYAPQRVRRVILANTGARIGSPEMWDQRIATVQDSGMASLAEAILERWFTPPYRSRHPAEMESIRSMIAATDPAGYVECCGVLRDTDLREEIATITVPALVIAGTHDPATPPSEGRALYAGMRNSKYVELDASHLSAWERAEEFADAVCAFLGGEKPCHG